MEIEDEIIKVPKNQIWDEKNLLFDPDSSPKAWEYYKKYYTNITYLDNLSKVYNKDTKSYRLESKVKIKNWEDEVKVAGDCSFNFNDKKKSAFESIINEDETLDEDIKAGLKDKLECCCEMHHTLYNFDLMPVSGGMNNIKGKLKYRDNKILVHDLGRPPEALYDRLDTFICLMDYSLERKKEYEGKKCNLKKIGIFFADSIFTYSLKGENFELLYELLENYENIYEYCKDFYNIDNKEFIGKLMDNGKSEIRNSEDLDRYMNLANEFWKFKKEICKV